MCFVPKTEYLFWNYRCPECSLGKNEDIGVDKNDLIYDTEDVPEEEEKQMDYEEATGQKEHLDDDEEAAKKKD